MKDYILSSFESETRTLRKNYFGEIAVAILIFLPQFFVYPFILTQDLTTSISRLIIGILIMVLLSSASGIILVFIIKDIIRYRENLRSRSEISFLENYLADDEGTRNRWALAHCASFVLGRFKKSMVYCPGLDPLAHDALADSLPAIDSFPYTSIWRELADRGLKSDTLTAISDFCDTAIVFKVQDDASLKLAFVFLPTGNYYVRSIDLKSVESLDTVLDEVAKPFKTDIIYSTDLKIDDFSYIFP